MINENGQGLEVDSCHIYSLDRCIKCLSVLNLGHHTLCTVNLKKAPHAAGTPDETGPDPDWIS